MKKLIYYKNKKVSSLLMKNDLNVNKIELNRSHMVYKINCPVKDYDLSNPCYVGYTQNSWLLFSLPSVKDANGYKIINTDLCQLFIIFYFHKHLFFP